MIYTLRTLRRVIDSVTKEELQLGGTIITKDRARVERCLRQNICSLVSARQEKKKTGPKVVLYCSYLADYGGIETATENLVRKYGKKINMELVINSTSQFNLLHLSQYVNVVKDEGGALEFSKDDILILVNYDTGAIIPRITKWPKKIYQQNHAVWDKLPGLHFNQYVDHKDKINAVLSVSDEARRGLKARYGVDSVFVPNVASKPDEAVIFGFFSRSSAEKGFDTIAPAIKKFREYGKPFYFLVSTTLASSQQLDAVRFEPEVIMLQGSIKSRGLIHCVDYLWQLSTTESMGLSVYEALLSGVPVIASKIPTFTEIIEHGKNGYLVEHDLSDLPVKEIFDKKLVGKRSALIELKTKEEEELWRKVFAGDI